MNENNINFNTINTMGRNSNSLKNCPFFRTVINTPHLSISNYSKMELASKKLNDFLFNYKKSKPVAKSSKRLLSANLSNINKRNNDSYKDKEIKREIYYLTKNIVSNNKFNKNNSKYPKNRKFSFSSIRDLNIKTKNNNNFYNCNPLSNRNYFSNKSKKKNILTKKEEDKKEYYKFLYDMKRMKNNFVSNTTSGNNDNIY